MSDENNPGGFHIDSDWKEEAAKEKEKLAQKEQQRKQTGDGATGEQNNFIALVNMIAMQAMVGLTGYQGPSGEALPPNLEIAKQCIDMLDVLDAKTEGNLAADEKKTLNAVLYELRMGYIQRTQGGSDAMPPSGA